MNTGAMEITVPAEMRALSVKVKSVLNVGMAT